ncbi:hypothetical protein [Okeania sp. SIO2G5]|uniref:hypothetical protein n=1 Tax=Okeania sp. SIO2G5 TaxID=2607796 RepID=UPI0013C22A77|nr:hypothetical protein [Okeania sp. SIO2G5]NEP75934.1 hypothetical protein [Okeania sp. SIO2G5]
MGVGEVLTDFKPALEDKLQTAVSGLQCLRSIASAKQEASSKAHAIMLWVSLGKFSRTVEYQDTWSSRCSG